MSSAHFNPDGIPNELKAIPRWLLWRLEERDGKPTKTPYQTNGRMAKVNDPSTWTDFDTALAAYQAGGFDGLGIALSKDDDLIGVDLDKCLNPATGELESEAARIVADLPTYCEQSPSGRGLRLFGFGTLPQGGRRKGKVEMYADGRYLTVTGNRFNGHESLANITAELATVHARIFGKANSTQPVGSKPGPANALNLDDAALFNKIRASKQGALFDRLWRGDAGDDHSAADMALCNLLAYWTDGDAARMDRLFRQSGLVREKWDKPHFADGRTYGQATVEKAIADLREGYGSRSATTQRAAHFEDERKEQASNMDASKKKPLARHSKAAEIIFNSDFKRQIIFNTVSNQWLQYDERNGCFVAKPDVSIQRDTYQAVKRIGVPFDASYISGVVKCLMFEAAQEVKPKVGKICFRNGVLNLKTRVLENHSPVNHFTSGLPFDWEPNAEPPAPVIEWLLKACGGNADQVELARAFINAVITGRADLQRFLELIGPGGGGKGTLIRLMTALVGKENVHATSLKQLEENRFESAKLFGKKLVIIGDAEKWHGDVSTLKAITGQDSIRFEQKHQQAGENFTYGGMVVIAANQHTESTDYSSGIQRRRITVPFEHVVPVEQRRDLEAEFEPYLPAVIKWALDLPQERVTELLRSTSKYVPSLKEARLSALAATNPIVAWLLESAYFDPEAKTQIGVCKELRINEGGGDGDQVTTTHTEFENESIWLYANYCAWCRQNGKRPLAKNTFANVVIDAAQHMLGKPFVRRGRDTKGRYIVGISLDSCQPMSTYDNLMTTQVIDCAEDVNLDTFFNKNNKNIEDKPDKKPQAPPTVEGKKPNNDEYGGKSGGNVEGRHVQHDQEVRLSLGRHGSTQVDINQPQDRHAATAAPSVTNPTRCCREDFG